MSTGTCEYIINRGMREGEVCGRPVAFPKVCHHHARELERHQTNRIPIIAFSETDIGLMCADKNYKPTPSH